MQAMSLLADFALVTSGFAFQPGQWHESVQNELAGVMTQLPSHHASEEPMRMLLQTEDPATLPVSTTLGVVTPSFAFGLGDALGLALPTFESGVPLALVAFTFRTSFSQAPVLKVNSPKSSAPPSLAWSARPATLPATRSTATSRSMLTVVQPGLTQKMEQRQLPNEDSLVFFAIAPCLERAGAQVRQRPSAGWRRDGPG